MSCNTTLQYAAQSNWQYDTQHNDTQHYDHQQVGLILAFCVNDIQHNDTQL
jgi:hypothetical protein